MHCLTCPGKKSKLPLFSSSFFLLLFFYRQVRQCMGDYILCAYYHIGHQWWYYKKSSDLKARKDRDTKILKRARILLWYFFYISCEIRERKHSEKWIWCCAVWSHISFVCVTRPNVLRQKKLGIKHVSAFPFRHVLFYVSWEQNTHTMWLSCLFFMARH